MSGAVAGPAQLFAEQCKIPFPVPWPDNPAPLPAALSLAHVYHPQLEANSLPPRLEIKEENGLLYMWFLHLFLNSSLKQLPAHRLSDFDEGARHPRILFKENIRYQNHSKQK